MFDLGLSKAFINCLFKTVLERKFIYCESSVLILRASVLLFLIDLRRQHIEKYTTKKSIPSKDAQGSSFPATILGLASLAILVVDDGSFNRGGRPSLVALFSAVFGLT